MIYKVRYNIIAILIKTNMIKSNEYTTLTEISHGILHRLYLNPYFQQQNRHPFRKSRQVHHQDLHLLNRLTDQYSSTQSFGSTMINSTCTQDSIILDEELQQSGRDCMTGVGHSSVQLVHSPVQKKDNHKCRNRFQCSNSIELWSTPLEWHRKSNSGDIRKCLSNRCTSCRKNSDGTWPKLPRNLAAGPQITSSCENVWELQSDAISLTVLLPVDCTPIEQTLP